MLFDVKSIDRENPTQAARMAGEHSTTGKPSMLRISGSERSFDLRTSGLGAPHARWIAVGINVYVHTICRGFKIWWGTKMHRPGHPTDEDIKTTKTHRRCGKEPTILLKYLTSILEVRLSAQSKKTTVTEQQTSELKEIFTSKAGLSLELTLNCGTTYRHREGSISPSFARSGRPYPFTCRRYRYLSTNIFADIRNLTLYIRSVTTDPLEPLTPEINLLLRKLDNFQKPADRTTYSSQRRSNKRSTRQNPIEITAITGYQGQIFTATRGTTASTATFENYQPPIPVRQTVHRPIRQPHNQPTNPHNLSPEQRSRRTADVVANLDRLRAAFQHSLRLRNREI
ncbi:hypothetical protein OUZ56_024616 [Daphnia magna]|uniref:Uncharacterized protein n=1 Tax=Daphnia magna TaxID=35525 RepID=A0ABR0B132_9CRUS|nr:hypothetical protein OUZ56_024616 [Daphnia magna]